MKYFIYLIFVLSVIGCSNSSVGKKDCAIDTTASVIEKQEVPVEEPTAEEPTAEESMKIPDELSQFKSVLDTLNAPKDRLVHSYYFLYDITGDGIPELWIKSGCCEADYVLMAYTLESGNPRKIYEGGGGHSDYYISNGQLLCVMCNMGEGFEITYSYNGKHVVDHHKKFSVWDEDVITISVSESDESSTDEKQTDWEELDKTRIELKPIN